MEENDFNLHLALGILPDENIPEFSDKLPETYSVAGCEANSARTGSWELFKKFKNKTDLLNFFYTYSFKMTTTHGNQTNKFPLHIEKDSHTYGYYACSSKRCLKLESVSGSLRIRVSSVLISTKILFSLHSFNKKKRMLARQKNFALHQWRTFEQI